jgi:hypothetical protein
MTGRQHTRLMQVIQKVISSLHDHELETRFIIETFAASMSCITTPDILVNQGLEHLQHVSKDIQCQSVFLDCNVTLNITRFILCHSGKLLYDPLERLENCLQVLGKCTCCVIVNRKPPTAIQCIISFGVDTLCLRRLYRCTGSWISITADGKIRWRFVQRSNGTSSTGLLLGVSR